MELPINSLYLLSVIVIVIAAEELLMLISLVVVCVFTDAVLSVVGCDEETLKQTYVLHTLER